MFYKIIFAFSFLILIGLPQPAFSQEYSEQATLDTIAVTGLRMDEYESEHIPSVVLKKRPDHVTFEAKLYCDRRDDLDRRTELETSLEDLFRKVAKKDGLSLAHFVEYDTDFDTIIFVVPLSEKQAKDKITTGRQPNTSRVDFILKLEVQDGDTFEGLEKRVNSFIETLKPEGRYLVPAPTDPALTIQGLQSYRAELIDKIQKDALDIIQARERMTFELSGLENQIRWVMQAPFELTLYIPYTLTIQSK